MQNFEFLIPLFFKILITLTVIKMIISLFLFRANQLKIYKFLTTYWAVLVSVYVIQALIQENHLAIILAYSATIAASFMLASIGFKIVGRQFPHKKYILYVLPFYPITYLLSRNDFEFVTVAMPLAIGAATPLLHSSFYMCAADRKKTTPLQKFLAYIYLLQAIHCITFALFRAVEGSQIWLWLIAYALYDSAAIFLSAIVLEKTNRTDNDRLTALVNKRTSELNQSLKENENLLKVLLHDISSPLMTMRFYLHYLRTSKENEELIEKAKKSHSAIEKIILEVKNIYGKKKKKDRFHLQPVNLENCFNDVSFIFAQRLERKNISLIIVNHLNEKAYVLADQTTLTHSVISNIVSNSLKFSFRDSQIRISVSEQNEKIIIEISDQGPGIPDEIIRSINNNEEPTSSEGTSGELGTGFGLSIVKSFVDYYGGQLEFISRTKMLFPNDHGTSVRISLLKA